MKCIGLVLRLFLTAVVIAGFAGPAFGQGGTASFSGHGEVASGEGDAASLRGRARRALLVDGVSQAVAGLVSAETQKRLKTDLRKNVYNQPDRYVMSYQILSENVRADSFELTGEVTVSLDLLRTDLVQLGAVELEPADTGAAASGAGAAATGVAESTVAAFPVAKDPATTPGREILWVVSERWSSGWILPRDNDYGASPFLLGVAREIRDYGWNLVPPRDGSLSMETGGRVVLEDVLALAGAMTIATVVYGRVSGRPVAATTSLVDTDLDVIDVTTRQSIGKIHQEWKAVGVNDHEAAVQLANLVVPGIDQLLTRGAVAGSQTAPAAGSTITPAAGTAGAPAVAGEQVIVIRGNHPYAAWEALESLLTEHSGALRLNALELVPDAVRAHVSGVDLDLFATFDGYRLNDRFTLHLDRISQQDRTVYFNTSAPDPSAQPATPEQ